MPKIINSFDVADCNRALKEAGLGVRLHMHDVCGGQYFSWDGDDADAPEVPHMLERFFAARGANIDFIEGEHAFTSR